MRQHDVNPGKDKRLDAAVYGTRSFDVKTLKQQSLRVGSITGTETKPDHMMIRDINGDRIPDLVFSFGTYEADIKCGDKSLLITGTLTSGRAITGKDTFKTVACQMCR